MDWLFVGDAHFAFGDSERRRHFFNFIQRNKSTLNTLVLMGDFFDFWFGFRDPSPLTREYADILTLLKQLRSDGVEIIYLEGNHEFRMEPYMREKLGIDVYDNCAEMELDGERVYLAHGDRAYPTFSHRILTWLLRNSLTYLLISLLGPRTVIAVAQWWSAKSRKRNLKESAEVISRLKGFAQRKLNEGFDTVILAHTHLPEEIPMKKRGGEGYYFNVGNWMKDFSYLRYNEKQGFSLEYYRPD
jgi:UDP-2,3-diacylglucosamine hydrolase